MAVFSEVVDSLTQEIRECDLKRRKDAAGVGGDVFKLSLELVLVRISINCHRIHFCQDLHMCIVSTFSLSFHFCRKASSRFHLGPHTLVSKTCPRLMSMRI